MHLHSQAGYGTVLSIEQIHYDQCSFGKLCLFACRDSVYLLVYTASHRIYPSNVGLNRLNVLKLGICEILPFMAKTPYGRPKTTIIAT